MRFSIRFPMGFLLLVLAGSASTAQAPASHAEYDKRFAFCKELLATDADGLKAVAMTTMTELSVPPVEGVPIFRANLQRHTYTIEEAFKINAAIRGLAHYGVEARSALPDLILLMDEVSAPEGIKNRGEDVSSSLVIALSKIGPDDPTAIDALKRTAGRCLDSPNMTSLLDDTAQALSHMSRSAHTAVPVLTRALDRCPNSTSFLAAALSRMLPEAARSIPTLIRSLEAGRSPADVADALGTMGPAAKSAIPALQRCLMGPSPVLASRAYVAVAHIEGVPTLTLPASLVVLKQLDKRRLSQVYAAFTTVKLAGTPATGTLDMLVQFVNKRKEPWLRRAAIETLAAVGPESNLEAARLLILAVQNQDPVIAMGVDKAFEEFRASAKQVVPELSVLLLSTNASIRNRAEQLLSPLGHEAAPTVPNLIRELQTDMSDRRLAKNVTNILQLLGQMGPEARDAAPVLTDLLLKTERETNGVPGFGRKELLIALMKIGITPRVLPVVREMLQSAHPTQVACAAHAIAMLGRPVSDTVPFLLLPERPANKQLSDTAPLLLRPLRQDYKDEQMTSEFFEDNNFTNSARIETIRALASIGQEAKEALPLLQSVVDFPERLSDRPAQQALLKQEALMAIRAIKWMPLHD
jgi:HEAT repeat protein